MSLASVRWSPRIMARDGGPHDRCAPHHIPVRSTQAHGGEGLGAGRRPRRDLRLLRDGHPRLPDLHRLDAPAGEGRHRQRRGALHRRGHHRRAGTVPRPGIDGVRVCRRARRLPRARLHRGLPAPRDGLRGDAAAGVRHRRTAPGGDLRVPHQPVRRGHRDPDLHRQPGQGLRGQHPALRTVLRRGLQPERAGPERDQRPGAGSPAHGVLRLDRVGVGGRTARPHLLLHQQLAGRAPGGQQPDGRRGGVERPVARRAARRHRRPVRGLRPLERQGRLAQRGGPGNLVPPTQRGGPDPGPARDGLVLLHDRGVVSGPDAAGRRGRALPGRHPELLRLRPRRAPPVQPGPDLAPAARPVLDRGLVPGRRDLPDPVHRRTRAPQAVRSRLCPLRRGRRGRGRQPAERGPVDPRRLLGEGAPVRPAVGVPRPAAHLAGPADDRHVRLDRDHLPGDPVAPGGRVEGQHALVVLLLRPVHSGVLRDRAAGRHRHPPHRRGVLAVLGGAPVGRGLPRALHHGDGRLHLRDARRRPRDHRPRASSSST